MNKKINILLGLFWISLTYGLVAHEFDLSLVSSDNLNKERNLFINFWQVHCAKYKESETCKQDLSQIFDEEESDYQEQCGQTLFVHATCEDKVIGYISFDIASDYQVSIRQLAVDSVMVDPMLVKALILAIFSYVPRCREISITLYCEAIEMIKILDDIGFVQDACHKVAYKLTVGDRCKLCEALYGKDFWETQEDSQDDDFAPTGEDWGAYDID